MPQPLFAAGFSMGGIILANYCGQFGEHTLLQGAVVFSPSYDAIMNMEFQYSRQVWQPYLVYPLKKTFMRGRYGAEAARRGVNIV